MNFYPLHIGDYASHTRHLTLMGDLAYRRLLDLYYLTERALPSDAAECARLIGMRDHIQDVSEVLSDFFLISDAGWTNLRADREIAAYYQAKANHWGRKLTKEQRCAIQAARNDAKSNATPAWLTANHHAEIARVYAKARAMTDSTGVSHEVDHIVPIRSDAVCGLHVPWNLRVITAVENRVKSNQILEVAS